MSGGEVLGLLFGLAGFAFMFFVVLLPTVRDIRNRKRAREGLPGLAAELGLRYKRPDSDAYLGSYQGGVEKHNVRITPDEYDKIRVDLNGERPGFYLSAPYSRAQRMLMPLLRLLGAGPDDEDNNFDFGDESLDKYFLLREADRGAIDELTSGAVRKSIETFVARHGPALDGLTIGSTTISCCPSVGRSNKMSSITPEQVRTLLPDMIGLARTIEKALGTG